MPELTINDVTFEGFISYSDGSGSMINEGVSDLNGTLGFTFNPASTENAVNRWNCYIKRGIQVTIMI